MYSDHDLKTVVQVVAEIYWHKIIEFMLPCLMSQFLHSYLVSNTCVIPEPVYSYCVAVNLYMLCTPHALALCGCDNAYCVCVCVCGYVL